MFIMRNKALLVVSVLLAIPFLFGGLGSTFGAEPMAENFTRFGFPRWFMHFVGVAEVAGAIGLFVQRTALYAAVCLGILMIGAVGTHLMNDPPAQAVPAFIILVMCGVAVYLNRGMANVAAS